MADLKSIRLTLQECIQDDATGLGSGSRLAVVMSILTLCVGLTASIAGHLFGIKDMTGIIGTLTTALGLGGGGPYVLKQVFGKALSAPPDPTKETP